MATWNIWCTLKCLDGKQAEGHADEVCEVIRTELENHGFAPGHIRIEDFTDQVLFYVRYRDMKWRRIGSATYL